MLRRYLPYGIAVAAVGLAAAALGLIAWLLQIQRIETFLLVFVLLVGAIGWRYGRGPAVAGAVAAVLVSDYYFLAPQGAFRIASLSDGVRLLTGILAAAAVIWFVDFSRGRQVLLEKRKDLLQDVSPMILRSLDAEEILDTVAEATLRVIDYQHFRLYRWDEAAERLVLVKSLARADPYTDIDWHLVTLSLGEGITGIAAKTQHSLLVPDASRDSRMVYPVGTAPIEESILSVPMVTLGRLFGVLSLARLGIGSLSTEDMRLMESIAAQTALALANAEQYAEAEQTIKALATIEALQPGDGQDGDTEIDARILQGFDDLSQSDLATLRVLQADGRYHVGATGGRLWPAEDAPTGEALSPADVAWLADPKVTVYVADPQTDAKLPEWALREFMQIASHELRTPLTVIRGYASLLEEGSLGVMPPLARQALHTLLDKSSEMRAYVERMLLLARLEDGAAPPQMAAVDLRRVVTDAVDRVRPQVELKHGTLEMDLAPAPLTVLGDPERLATAVDNLLQNAVKFSDGPPRIEVSGNRQNGKIHLVVKDHGIGIPAAARTRLFEKFYRVETPELQNVVGTGIGLYLVRQVVEGHGGQVEVDSQPGEGSAFEIDLPAVTEPA
jgi:signal transduction histidine kinase